MKQITNECLRYVYPLFFEETLDRATPKVDRYEKPNGTASWKYERVPFSEAGLSEEGVFPFSGDVLYAETGDKAGTGRSWIMKQDGKKPFLSTRFTAKLGKEEEQVTVAISSIGLVLTRMHTGFLWIEMTLTAERITAAILMDFQKNLIEANPFAEWIAEWVSPLNCRFVPERKKEEKSLPIHPCSFLACVAEDSTEGERKKLKESLCTEGCTFVYAKPEEMPGELRTVYFFLYLRALYRKYVSLYFVERIRRTVSAAKEDYVALTEKDSQKIEQKKQRREKLLLGLQDLHTELTVYLAVNTDAPSSFFDRHNEFEAKLRRTLDLDRLERSLERSRGAVEMLAHRIHTEITKEEEEKKRAKEAEKEALRKEEEEQKQGSVFSRFGKRHI